MTGPVPPAVMDAEFVLGFDELPAGRRREIQRFFVAVIEQRGIPLHLNCLWNALYHRWDLDAGSYPDEALNFDILESVELGRVGPALPVGAFAHLPTQTAAGDLVGEVVTKSGWHPAITAGHGGFADVPAEIAGAAAATARLHERVVVDLDAFAELNLVTPTQLRRMKDRGVWLDDLGHLVYDAAYPSVDAADQDDTSFYIDWLLIHRRAGLLDWAFDLPEGMQLDPDELDQAVSATFATVEQLLTSTPGLVRWGDLFWTEAAYRRYIGTSDTDGEGPLNRGELETLTRMVAGTYGQPVRYTAVAAEVDSVGLDRDRRDATLGGTAWVAAIVAANLWLTRQINARADDGAITTVDGPVHVRLDDRWQHGGLWRTEPADQVDQLWYLRVPFDRPLGLGSSRSSSELPTSLAEQAPASAPAVEEVEELSETEATWIVVLGSAEMADGRLPVPPEVARRLPDGPVAVRLTHRTGPAGLTDVLSRTWRTSWRRGSDQLTGLGWPAALPVGIRLHCRLPYAGQTVDVETRRLDAAVQIGDVELAHYHDPATVQAAAARQPRRQQQRRLAEQAAVIFDTLVSAPDGSCRLQLATLCELLFGAGAAADPARVAETLAVADELGLVRRGSVLVRSGSGRVPGRKVTTLDESTRQQLAGVVRRDIERMRLTPLSPGEQAPEEADYAADRAAAGETATLPVRLPRGYTYVKPKRMQGPTNQHALGLGDGDVDYYGAGKDWD